MYNETVIIKTAYGLHLLIYWRRSMSIRADHRYYLKLKALYYIYEKGYTNTRTSELLGISRVTLNRLLDEAKSDGMIKVTIVDTRDIRKNLEYEEALKAEFGMKDVSICGCPEDGALLSSLASAGAEYAGDFIDSGMKIGIAWGKTIRSMISYMTPNRTINDLDIYTLLGGAPGEADYQPNVIAQGFLNLYSGRSHVINSPHFCHSELLQTEIMKEPSIADIMEAAGSLDLAIVGIGESPTNENFKNGYYHFDDDVIEELVQAGAVGDICGNFFNIEGRLCRTPMCRRLVSIDVEKLKSCPNVIAVAGGEGKRDSIIGAMRSGLINRLVTDSITAENILSVI